MVYACIQIIRKTGFVRPGGRSVQKYVRWTLQNTKKNAFDLTLKNFEFSFDKNVPPKIYWNPSAWMICIKFSEPLFKKVHYHHSFHIIHNLMMLLVGSQYWRINYDTSLFGRQCLLALFSLSFRFMPIVCLGGMSSQTKVWSPKGRFIICARSNLRI